MDPQALIKALLINAAYEGAIAVCAPLNQEDDGTPIKIDPLIQDAGLQKKGVLVYEEAKVQYNALLRAFQDKTGVWPDPQVSAAAPAAPNVANLAGVLASVLKGLPPTSPIGTVGQLLALLSQAGASVPAMPGQELTPNPAAAPTKQPA
jgi:hypothetical protein